MRVKDDTVNLADLHPKMHLVLPKLDRVWRDLAGYQAIITSGCDGKHGARSRHYIGCAVDLRTWTDEHSGVQLARIDRELYAHQLRQALGEHYQVLDEGSHFHIAFNPNQPITWGDLV